MAKKVEVIVGLIDKTGKGSASAKSNIGNIGKAAVVAGAAVAAGAVIVAGAVAKVAFDGVKAAISMEEQMSGIAAIFSTTVDEIAPLGDLIKELGLNPNLKVNATEAADAIEMLGKNGLTMAEILDGAAESTVLLANATDAQFSVAADIGTDAMTLFNIEAENMIEAVDGITAVTVSSKFDINDYALALAQGGGVAATAGVSFEGFNTTIAAIAPLFASGSDAGTSMKTMIMRLAPQTTKASDAMAALGLNFFDTEGEMVSMANVSEQLQTALYGTSNVMVEVGGRTGEQNAELERLAKITSKARQNVIDYTSGVKGATLSEEARAKKIAGLNLTIANTEAVMKPLLGVQGEYIESTKTLTEEERLKALTVIFGSDAMRAAAGLADAGAVAYTDAALAAEELGVSVDEVNQFMEGGITQFEALMISMGKTDAMAAAATRMDNVAGAMEIFEGIVDTVQLSIGQALLPVIRIFIDKLIVLAETWLPAIEEGLTVFTTVLGALFDNLAEGMSPMDAFLEAIWDFIPPELAAKLADIRDGINLFIEQITTALEPVIAFITKHVELKDVFIALGIVIASVVIPIIVSIIAAILPVIAVFALIVAAVAAMRWAWENNFGGIQEKTKAVITFVSKLIQTVMTFVREFWEENGDAILLKAQEIWETIKTAISVAITVISAIITVTMAAIQAFWEANGDAILAKAQAIWAAILSAITSFIGLVRDIIVTVATYLQGFWERHGEALLAGAKKAWGHIQTAINLAFDYIQVLFETFAALFKGDWATFGEKIVELWDLTIEMIVEVIAGLWDLIVPILAGLWEDFKGWFDKKDWKSIGSSIINGIKEGVKAAASSLATAVANAAQAAYDAVAEKIWKGSPSRLFMEIGDSIGEGMALGMTNRIPTVRGAAVGMATAAINSAAAVSNTTNNYYLTAKYGNQSPGSLTQDVRLMEMLAAV